jgi:two-component system sensor histidine kinase UhpB
VKSARLISKPAGLAPLVIFSIGYVVAVALSEHGYGSLAVPSPFWLPDSVLLCALLLTPVDEWWIFVTAILPLRLFIGTVSGTPVWFQVLTIAIDAAKAIAAAWLLSRVLGRRVRLETLSEFFTFLAITAVAVPAISAIVAAPARYLLGDPFWSAAYRWYLGDALAQVIVTPTILYWCAGSYRCRSPRSGELIALLISLAVASLYAFVFVRNGHALRLVYVPVPFLVWAAVRLRPFGTANAIALVAVIAMIGAARGTGMFSDDGAASSVLSLQLFLAVIGVSLLSLAIQTVERETLTEREREVNRRILSAQEEERSRIARELHDDLAQDMALLHLSLEHLGTSADLSAETHNALGQLVEMSSQMMSSVRKLSHELHPATLDLIGLDIAVKSLCGDIERQHGLPVEYRSQEVPKTLDRMVSVSTFRIAQEALRNVVKHSRATAAAVDLSRQGNQLVLCVSDDGDGFDIHAVDGRTGLGLISMRERLTLIGGQLSIYSTPLVGTRIRVEVPLERRPAMVDEVLA